MSPGEPGESHAARFGEFDSDWPPALTPQYQATQPWVKGYGGELGSYSENIKHLARIWIDQEMKEAMGY